MRDNVGIVEISSDLMRELLQEACAAIGRVRVYASVAAARSAFEAQPPKVLVLGGAPLSADALAFLHDAVHEQCVIALTLVDRHELEAAMHAGASDGYARNPEGLRQLKMRLRPLLAPSVRPPADERAIISWSSRAPAGTGAAVKQLGSLPADRLIRDRELPPPTAAGSAALRLRRCSMIALASGPHSADGVAYVLSRLPTTLPGIVLQQHGLGANTAAFVQRLNEETAWRAREGQVGDAISAGCVLVAPSGSTLRVRLGPLGPQLAEFVAGASPSSDALLESVARAIGDSALGVLFASSSDDGARGLRALRDAGAYTLLQRAPPTQRNSHGPSNLTHESQRPASPEAPAAVSGTVAATAHECVALSELPQTITAYCASRMSKLPR